jgi:hypothetical protein
MKTQQTFQFVTIEELWAFKSQANLKNFEISMVSKTLTFESNQEQFELAINTYNATVIGINKPGKTA